MTTRHSLRMAAAAALAALAGSGAWAIEATQWNPQADATLAASINTDATREPGAWTVARGEATEFHDGIARDTMRSRATVHEELAEARTRGWLADAGEAGATDGVWKRRAAFVASERDRELAQNTVQQSADPIGAIAAMETQRPADHGLYTLAADDTTLRMPSNQTPDLPDDTPVAMAPLAGDMRHEDLLVAEGPKAIDDGTGPLAETMTVEAR